MVRDRGSGLLPVVVPVVVMMMMTRARCDGGDVLGAGSSVSCRTRCSPKATCSRPGIHSKASRRATFTRARPVHSSMPCSLERLVHSEKSRMGERERERKRETSHHFRSCSGCAYLQLLQPCPALCDPQATSFLCCIQYTLKLVLCCGQDIGSCLIEPFTGRDGTPCSYIDTVLGCRCPRHPRVFRVH